MCVFTHRQRTDQNKVKTLCRGGQEEAYLLRINISTCFKKITNKSIIHRWQNQNVSQMIMKHIIHSNTLNIIRFRGACLYSKTALQYKGREKTKVPVFSSTSKPIDGDEFEQDFMSSLCWRSWKVSLVVFVGVGGLCAKQLADTKEQRH